MSENDDKYREIINQLCKSNCCDETPCEEKYCILKEIVFHSRCPVKTLYQLKCIEFFRKDLEKERDENVDPNYAANKWVEDEYNVLFRRYFDEALSCEEVYRRIMEEAESSESE